MSFKWEFTEASGNKCSNALRFASKKEAEDYGLDLAMRWTAAPPDAQAVECEDPVNYHYGPAGLTPIKVV